MSSSWMSLLAAATLGAAVGYWASLRASGAVAAQTMKQAPRLPAGGEEEEEDDDDVEALKMILVVRQDLKMGKGKIAAQCCHAAVGVVQEMYETDEGCQALERWEYMGATKVAVKGETEEVLLKVQQRCEEVNIPSYMVIDAGRTQIAPNSRTVLAVGPAPVSLVDKVTGDLKLL